MWRWLILAIFLSGCAEGETMASLQVGSEHGTYLVEVERHESEPNGYPIRFRCIDDCRQPVDLVEPIGDHPMGLFSRDQDDLVFYLSAGGVAYQVRAWQMTDAGVKRVLEAYTRARLDFLSDANGHAVVQTYEGESNMGPLRLVRWTFRDGGFVREVTNETLTTPAPAARSSSPASAR